MKATPKSEDDMAGKHWIQYHTPDRMGYGIDECGIRESNTDETKETEGMFSLVTKKDLGIHNPVGDVAWVVGKTQDVDSPVYLGWWFIVKDVVPSLDPNFLYQFVGEVGASCFPQPIISNEPWYPRLLGMTGNFKFGLTEINIRAVLDGLRTAATNVGCPLP